MKTLTAVLLAALAVDCFGAAMPGTTPPADDRPSGARGTAIYGEDSRVELREAPSPARELGAAVAAIVSEGDLQPVNGRFRMKARSSYGATERDEGRRACAGERFADQPNWSNCTGSLVAPDVLLTAGHCVSEATCARKRFVFDYALGENGLTPEYYSSEQVFACKSVIASGKGKSDDWALVRLDRKPGRAPLKVGLHSVVKGQSLYMIGHPAGLPSKYADDAVVIGIRPGGMVYEADLDAYGGNSGSPVFDAVSNRVVGVLVEGENDFQAQDGCWSSEGYRQFFRRRGLTGALSERVTAVQAFAEPLVERALSPQASKR